MCIFAGGKKHFCQFKEEFITGGHTWSHSNIFWGDEFDAVV